MRRRMSEAQEPDTPSSSAHEEPATEVPLEEPTEQQPESAPPLPDASPELTEGFLERYGPIWNSLLSHLTEIRENQTGLIDRLHADNVSLYNLGSTTIQDLSETFLKIPGYVDKIKSLRKEMESITKQMAKLKTRAQRLRPSAP
eukprot:gnl/Trimastix_PCT/1358.p1 GENE.gnl/Trimastix_PCT/1358~~gnl/Trimastix_PCT/1358.p1  ORF type:complete len:144 (-),score=2.65 gnl/Trimastix_PCT/1358:27-458(-)